MKSWGAALSTIVFLGPSFLMFLTVALVVAVTCTFAGRQNFAQTLGAAIVFGTFGYVLGVFIGTVDNSQVGAVLSAVLGTVATLLSTYVAYTVGKDSSPEVQKLLMSSLLTFLLTVPLTVFYMREYLYGT